MCKLRLIVLGSMVLFLTACAGTTSPTLRTAVCTTENPETGEQVVDGSCPFRIMAATSGTDGNSADVAGFVITDIRTNKIVHASGSHASESMKKLLTRVVVGAVVPAIISRDAAIRSAKEYSKGRGSAVINYIDGATAVSSSSASADAQVATDSSAAGSSQSAAGWSEVSPSN